MIRSVGRPSRASRSLATRYTKLEPLQPHAQRSKIVGGRPVARAGMPALAGVGHPAPRSDRRGATKRESLMHGCRSSASGASFGARCIYVCVESGYVRPAQVFAWRISRRRRGANDGFLRIHTEAVVGFAKAKRKTPTLKIFCVVTGACPCGCEFSCFASELRYRGGFISDAKRVEMTRADLRHCVAILNEIGLIL